MKLLSFIICSSLLFSLSAQELDTPTPPEIKLPPLEAAIDALFSIPATKTELESAIAAARKVGVSEQSLLEARFLFHVEHKDDQGIIGLLPDFEAKEKSFTLDNSEIFATKEDFLAVIEFARSLQALKQKKFDEFKKHITEALWLSPAQASAFTPYIEKLRVDQHIANTQLDFNHKISDLHTGAVTTLKAVLADHQAILLHFWSPWSPDCETAITDLSALKQVMADKKVILASLLIDDKTEIVTEAKEFLKALGTPLPGPQLLMTKHNNLAGQMRITDMPTMVLVNGKGKILFHGKPGDPLLAEAIKQISSAAPSSP